MAAGVRIPHELIVADDFDVDTTVPMVAQLVGEIAGLKGLRNELGRGSLIAIKASIAGSSCGYLLISRAEGEDEPHVVDPIVSLARGGADVVSTSRDLRGGR